MKRNDRKCLALLLAVAVLFMLFPIPSVSAAGYANGYTGGKNGDGIGIVAKGIDLSEWQGDSVDFNRIKTQGYSFVILRAGFATTADTTFENNYAKAKAAGLHVGVYLYSYAENTQEAKKEAAALRSWLSGKQLEYPVYYDIEEPETHGSMTKEQLTQIAMTFLDTMAADGWLVGLYSCRSWLEGKLDTAKICAKYECWLAQYLSSGTCDTYKDYDKLCGMWQYSSTGSVDGVPGGTDLDVCFKDYPTICKRYGFNGYSANGATLILNSPAVAEVIRYGENLNISGTVTSSAGNLSNVTVGFFDEDGAEIKTRSVGPKATTFDLSKVANDLKTKELPEGRYFYRVLATNTFETQMLTNQSVVISKNGVRTDHIAIPENLKQGDRFQTTGIVTATDPIKKVEVSVKSGNKVLLSETAEPDAVKFDLAQFAEQVKFETLGVGTYSYCISVTLAIGSPVMIVSQAFDVWVKDDPITVSELSLKNEYFAAEAISLSGKINSAKSEMQGCHVEILNHKGGQEATASSAAKSKSFSLQELCEQMRLDALTVGAYRLVITAQNAGGPQTVLDKEFYIRPDAISLCECNAPATLEHGESFHLQGVITSDATALKFVSVSVLDINGKAHLSAGDIPEGKCYDLSDLNDLLNFSRLMCNDYTLIIRAENGQGLQTIYEKTLSVCDDRDIISWSAGRFRPEGISFYPGSSIGIKGTLISEQSEISEVKAAIYAADAEHPIASGRLSANGKSVSLDKLNQRLRFTALVAGEYRLVITAKNASETRIVMDAGFFVSDCLHEKTAAGIRCDSTCTRAGAIGDSRCLDCGAKVRAGQMLPRAAHSYQNGICTCCARKEFITVNAQKTQVLPANSGRIVLAASNGTEWFALGSNAQAVKIGAPDAEGRISVKADLLWTPEKQRDGAYLLRNAFGRLLHFDRSGLIVGTGIKNIRLLLTPVGEVFEICSQNETPQWLTLQDSAYALSSEACAVSVFVYLP